MLCMIFTMIPLHHSISEIIKCIDIMKLDGNITDFNKLYDTVNDNLRYQ